MLTWNSAVGHDASAPDARPGSGSARGLWRPAWIESPRTTPSNASGPGRHRRHRAARRRTPRREERGSDALGDLCRLTFGRVEHQQDLRHGSMMTTTASASQGRRSLGTTAPNRAHAARDRSGWRRRRAARPAVRRRFFAPRFLSSSSVSAVPARKAASPPGLPSSRRRSGDRRPGCRSAAEVIGEPLAHSRSPATRYVEPVVRGVLGDHGDAMFAPQPASGPLVLPSRTSGSAVPTTSSVGAKTAESRISASSSRLSRATTAPISVSSEAAQSATTPTVSAPRKPIGRPAHGREAAGPNGSRREIGPRGARRLPRGDRPGAPPPRATRSESVAPRAQPDSRTGHMVWSAVADAG